MPGQLLINASVGSWDKARHIRIHTLVIHILKITRIRVPELWKRCQSAEWGDVRSGEQRKIGAFEQEDHQYVFGEQICFW